MIRPLKNGTLFRRSFAGAWIEIHGCNRKRDCSAVAPSRERGLKSMTSTGYVRRDCRSFAGAWIEISHDCGYWLVAIRRSFAGAWIEINFDAVIFSGADVAPSRERGLK